MTNAPVPVYPPGSRLDGPEPGGNPEPGVSHPAAAQTAYFRLPRTLQWAWWRPLVAGVLVLVWVLGTSTVIVLVGLVVYASQNAYSLIEVVETPQLFDGFLTEFVAIDAANPVMLFLALGSVAIWLPGVLGALWAVGMRPTGHIWSVRFRIRWGLLGFATGLAVGVLGVSTALNLGVSVVMGEELSPAWPEPGTILASAAVVLLVVPFQATAEELIFRGLLPQALGSWLRPGTWWWWLIVIGVPTLAFTFSHAYELWGLLDVGFFALAAMWLTLRSGGLEAAIGLHVVNNVVAFGVLLSGVLGTTTNEADQGSPLGLAISMATTLVFVGGIEWWLRRTGVARYSSWPERVVPKPAPVPYPVPVLLP